MGEIDPRKSALARLVQDSAASIADTLTLFNEPAPSGVKKVEWKEVITAAERVARHATTVGILWKGKVSKKEGTENIRSYVQALQGFLLMSHGSTAGAGPTLLSCIDRVSRQLVNSSLSLLRGAVAGSTNSVPDADLPVLVGHVWEASEAVKKAPASQHIAIGRSLAQVAVSIKDVIRELGDFQENDSMKGSSDIVDSNVMQTSAIHHDLGFAKENGSDSSDDESSDSTDRLSAEEMRVVESVKVLGLSLLSMIKQLLHIVAGTAKAAKDKEVADARVTSMLERILELSKDLGVGMDELGASLYLPQEIDVLQETAAQIESHLGNLQSVIDSLVGSIPEDFLVGLNASKNAAMSLNKILEARTQKRN